MKKLSILGLAITYVGVFLGAGFVSGQELWQFFACFGSAGLPGFVITTIAFYFINCCLLRLVRDTGVQDIGSLMTCGDAPWLRAVVNVLQYLFLFGLIVIMIAGAAALVHELTGLSVFLAGAVFTLLVFVTALLGLQGLAATFSVLVPVTTLFAVALGVYMLLKTGFSLAPASGSVSSLLPNWWTACLSYAAYNVLGTASVLIPFAGLIPDRKLLHRGLTLGSVLLVLLAWSIIAGLLAAPEAGQAELPLVALAAMVHPAFSVVGGILIGLGMFACALGTLMALLSQLDLHLTLVPGKRLLMPLLLLAAFALSLAGFGTLIGVVYPIFGYASIPLIVCLIINWHRRVRKNA